jgi:outer membrane protein
MRKIFFTVALFFTTIIAGNAQKYAYVDTQYILDNMQEYKDAQTEIDQLSIDWQKELEKKFGEIDKMYKQFQVDAVLLPEDTKKKREDEIIKAEKDAKDLQKKRFGKDGDLFKKRQELIKPIQDKVFNGISEYAREKNYAFVFDKSGALTIVYADSKLDISDEVLQKLGITPQQNTPTNNTNGTKTTTSPKSGKK